MAQIIVERTEGSLLDRVRPYKVVIDGQVRGSVRQNEKWSFDVAAGTHGVSFKIGYYHSPAVKVAVVARTRLVCRSSTAHAFGLLALLSPGSWISVREEDEAETIETPYPADLFAAVTSRALQAEKPSQFDNWLRRRSDTKPHGSMRLVGPRMDLTTQAKRLLELDLQEAVASRKLEIRYQPQIDLVTRRIVTFEALLHWRHPVHGNVPAADFVQLADELGLTSAVGQDVLEQACREAASWPDEVNVAVNIRTSQVGDAAFPGIVASALRAAGLKPSRLILEVTQAIAATGGGALAPLQALRKIGVRIAIDDYGVNEPSLGNLADGRIDEIKIHRSLVSGLGESRDRLAAVRAAIAMCADLKMPCCAVGVESKDDLEILRSEHCPQVQGHLFGTALEVREIAAVIARHNSFELEVAATRQSSAIPFRGVVELLSDLVIVSREQAFPAGPSIVYVNQAFLRVTGYSVDEVIGLSPAALQAAETNSPAVQAIRARLQTGGAKHEKKLFLCKNGTPCWLDIKVVPLDDESGMATYYAMIGREMASDQKQQDRLVAGMV